MSSKPNVLIFGGINSLAPILALHLVPLSGEPLVSHLRMVDKFSMNPPTTYVIKNFLQLLRDRNDTVDYRQANLTRQDSIAKCFTDPSPNSQPYTHVIDLTGELLFDRSPEIFISQTFNVALFIALEASKHPIKSYVRHVPPFYEQTENKIHKEDDPKGWKPWGMRGVWWHESIRAIGNIPNLPLVVVRGGRSYGPGDIRGPITTGILVAFVYKSLNKDLTFLWSSQLRLNTINSLDWAGAIWATSLWAADKPRTTLNQIAGVMVPPSKDKLVEETDRAVKKADGSVNIPVFNLVDEGDSDQGKLAAVFNKTFGIKTGFHGPLISLLAGLKIEDVFEDANELHLAQWAKILAAADPPLSSTPLSPMIYLNELQKHGCAMDGSKFRNTVDYKFEYPRFSEDTVRQTIESWRAEGIWPNTHLWPPS